MAAADARLGQVKQLSVVSFQFRVSEKKKKKTEAFTTEITRTEHRVHGEEKRQRLGIFNTEATENGAQSSPFAKNAQGKQRREPQAK